MKLISAITIAMVALGSIIGVNNNFRFADNLSPQKGISENSEPEQSDFEKAVKIIKKYEGLHQPRHYPLVGYGHLVLPGEKFNRSKALGEAEAEKLLRKDLLKNCAVFRAWGPDSLILGVLAYNIGSGATLRSSVAKKLKAGDRNIYENYIAHSRYRGKVHKQIRQRRIEEFETLFIKELTDKNIKTEKVIKVETEKPAVEQDTKAVSDNRTTFLPIIETGRLLSKLCSIPFTSFINKIESKIPANTIAGLNLSNQKHNRNALNFQFKIC